MFDDKDAEFISKFVTDNFKGMGNFVSLLNLLNKRISINRVNYWVIKKNIKSREYSCLDYIYQKSSVGVFKTVQLKEQSWNAVKSNIHCESCRKIIQILMQHDTSCYEIHEHLGGVQVIKVDLPDPLTGERVIYSFQFSMPEQTVESSDKLVLRCLLPVLFHTARLVSDDVSNQNILSNREMAVLEWIKQGKSTWDISQVLCITERTVNFHVKNIYRKLGVVSRAQAVAVAIDLGVIESFVVKKEDTVCIE